MSQFSGLEASNAQLVEGIAELEEEIETVERLIGHIRWSQLKDSCLEAEAEPEECFLQDIGMEQQQKSADELAHSLDILSQLCGLFGGELESSNQVQEAAREIDSLLD